MAGDESTLPSAMPADASILEPPLTAWNNVFEMITTYGSPFCSRATGSTKEIADEFSSTPHAGSIAYRNSVTDHTVLPPTNSALHTSQRRKNFKASRLKPASWVFLYVPNQLATTL